MVLVRDYKQQDLDATIKLMKVLSTVTKDPFDEENWQQQAKIRVFNPEYRTLLAEIDGTVVGMCFADVQRDERGLFHGVIRNVIVDPDYERKGIASQLISRAMRLFGELRVDSVQVQVSEEIKQVLHLFEKLGFECSRIVMEKDVVKLREYQEGDYEATKELMKLYLKATNEILDEQEWKQTIKLRMRNPQYRILISESEGNVTGMAFVSIRSDETGLTIGYLQNVIVHPKYRNLGFGKALLIRAVEILNVLNVDKIRIMGHVEIQKYLQYFEDVGFERKGYVMELKLNK